MAELPIMNALQIRYLAETVASLRGPEALKFALVEEDGRDQLKIVPADQTSEPALELRTPHVQPDRARAFVSIRAEGFAPIDLDRCDAVFWSESAVEKFLFPYYASKGMWDAAHILTRISQLWYGFVPGPDETPSPLTGVLGEDTDPIPFAMAHIPTSEYVPVVPSDVGAELHFLFRKADGTVLAKSLAEFLRQEAGAASEKRRPG